MTENNDMYSLFAAQSYALRALSCRAVSVCLSVTFVYCTETSPSTFSPSASPD